MEHCFFEMATNSLSSFFQTVQKLYFCGRILWLLAKICQTMNLGHFFIFLFSGLLGCWWHHCVSCTECYKINNPWMSRETNCLTKLPNIYLLQIYDYIWSKVMDKEINYNVYFVISFRIQVYWFRHLIMTFSGNNWSNLLSNSLKWEMTNRQL